MKTRAFLTLFLALASVGGSAPAQAEIIVIGGKQYDCEEIGGSGDCWAECPYSFDTCASSCGGGQQCWDKCPYSFDTCAASCGSSPAAACWGECPYSFDTCAASCGSGSECWDRCPYSFDTCAATCGANPAPLKHLFEATAGDRLLREQKRASKLKGNELLKALEAKSAKPSKK